MLRVALFDVSAEGLRQPHSLTGEVSMIATTKLDSVKLTVSSVEGNIITATFTGAEMRAEGVYTLTVAENHGEHSRAIDICHAFELVGCACEASGETIINDTTLDIESVAAVLPYTIDEVLDTQSTNAVQNRAVAQAIAALAKEIPDVSGFVTETALAESLSGKVDKVDGKGLSTNDYDNEAKAKVAKVEGKQDKLVVSTLGNGNIKVEGIGEFMPATPSGSPQHDLYTSVGAKWNAATGYWEFNGINDMTNADMSSVVVARRLNVSNASASINNATIYAGASLRANVEATYYQPNNTRLFGDGGLLVAESKIEVLVLNSGGSGVCRFTNLRNAFYQATRLRKIVGILDLSQCADFNFSFQYANNVEEVYIVNTKGLPIRFNSTKIAIPCLTYLVNNSGTATFTLTVPASVYSAAMADTDFKAALTAHTNVTFAQA